MVTRTIERCGKVVTHPDNRLQPIDLMQAVFAYQFMVSSRFALDMADWYFEETMALFSAGIPVADYRLCLVVGHVRGNQHHR